MSTKLVAVVNVTPDSFSDGGAALRPEDALRRVAAAIEEGASVVDVGAESTRPGAMPLSPEEEWARLSPLLAEAIALAHRRGAAVSVDTRHPRTARQAAALGADWINDVSGFASADMVKAVRASRCSLVVMHALTVPADPAVTMPEKCDPVAEVMAFACTRLAALAEQGIGRERVIFDPGIGFGKTAEQSLTLLRRVEEFRPLGVRLLIGHSRKSFLKRFTDAPPEGRDDATLAVSQVLAGKGVDYLRVHAVAGHARMLRVLQAFHE